MVQRRGRAARLKVEAIVRQADGRKEGREPVGDEFWMLDLLSREPQLLCNISYLFVEFHNLPGKRANLSHYGLDADMYEVRTRK